MGSRPIIVFADGAAINNPGPGGWGAIIVTPADRVIELGGADPDTTNNRMEMSAVIEALRQLHGTVGDVAVHTDSSYLVNGITKWIHGWRKRGWKTVQGGEVLNRPLWDELSDLAEERGRNGNVTWRHVRGHAGIPGNERCDEIASAHAGGRPCELYEGPLDAYEVDIFSLPDATTRTANNRSRGGSKKRKAAYSYLSVVDGIPMRHATWPECERRVKGKSGARFKKSADAADEAAILVSWGFSTADL